MGEMARDDRARPAATDPGGRGGDRELTRAVRALIREAESHPLGEGFLRSGVLDAVAATFGVHAFVVDAAREAIAASPAAARIDTSPLHAAEPSPRADVRA